MAEQTRIAIPPSQYLTAQADREGMPALISFDAGKFQLFQSRLFLWRLHVIVVYAQVLENGLPTQAELDAVNEIELNFIDGLIEQTGWLIYTYIWNGCKEYIVRVNNAERMHEWLQRQTDVNIFQRQWDYHMTIDESWEWERRLHEALA